MRSIIIASVFAALAVAAPAPQAIDLSAIDALPDASKIAPPATVGVDTVSIQPSAAATSIAKAMVTSTAEKRDFLEVTSRNMKRGDCAIQPAGSGPITYPDTPAAFLQNPTYSDIAKNAATPQGYSLSFQDLKASSQTVSYLGLQTLKSYDTVACASYCDQLDGCVAFNIYIERDPTKDPGDYCRDPASLTNYKCVRWGVQITPDTATNSGQYRDQFQVVIAGSNGYNKNSAPCPAYGFTGPIQLGGAINAPLDPVTQTDTYMGYKFFSFDDVQTFQGGVTACTFACSAQTAYNAAHPPSTGKPAICNQVVVYVLSDENNPQGIYCSMYTEEWAANYATNYGQYRGSHYWSVSQAYSYVNSTYTAKYPPICDVNGCPGGSYRGGNNGGYGSA